MSRGGSFGSVLDDPSVAACGGRGTLPTSCVAETFWGQLHHVLQQFLDSPDLETAPGILSLNYAQVQK